MRKSPEPAEPAASTGAGSKRRTTLAVVAIATVTALVVTSLVVAASVNAANDPEAAVLTYVKLIAKGKAEQANALVNPSSYSGKGEVDRKLLTNKVLTSASERITDIRVNLEDADRELETGDTVEVGVNYKLSGETGTATIRVKKLPNSWGLFDNWAVIDPLLIPVSLESNLRVFTTGTIGGATVTSVPLSSADVDVKPHPVLMYPAVYDVSGSTSKYVTPEASTARIVSRTSSESRAVETVPVQLLYSTTPALDEKVSELIPAHLEACAKAGQKMDDDCPMEFWLDRDRAVSVVETPVIQGLYANLTADTPGDTRPQLSFSALGSYSTTVPATDDSKQTLTVYGWILIEDETVSVTYSRQSI